MHFEYIATRLMQGDISPNELLDMIEGMGHPVNRDGLGRISLYYDFEENSFSLSLYRRRSPRKQKDLSDAGKD